MRVFFAIVLIGMTPALAQGVVNRRDSSGNLPRDKGVSTPTVLPHALVGASSPTKSRNIKIERRN
jgi:hypothetical protein